MPARRAPLSLLTLLVAVGCGGAPDPVAPSVAEPPSVRLTRADTRTVVKPVGQPAFIEAYERTSIYPKLTGYIEKWRVDIGDRVKKGDVLATLFIPELLQNWDTKKNTVKLDDRRVALAREAVKVSEADVRAAEARLAEAKAILAEYQAQVDRWDVQVKRLQREVDSGVVDNQVLLESQNQLKASRASKDSAQATIAKADADLTAKKAADVQARIAVEVAQADLAVATSDARRVEALVGYMTLTAPFDGTVVARNANTFDFVLPGTGDPTADTRAPYLSPSGTAAPIYVVDRTDIVRVFVDIPEEQADYVRPGTKATVLVKAFRDAPIAGSVTRTSWALNVKSRTLRAEIDLPNDGRLLPGMYAYATVIVERPGVRALPASALTFQGDRTFCWLYEKDRAVRTEVRTGLSGGDWVEVTGRRAADAASDTAWVPFDGSEQVILGDLTVLTDGGLVRITNPPADTKTTPPS